MIARDAAGNTASDESDASFSIVTLCVDPKVGALRNLPATFELRQNYPNPFNPTATIEYALPQAEKVELRVFNILGQAVKTLVDEEKPAGYHQVVWDGKDQLGRPLSSGVYIYKIVAGDFVETKKMHLVK